MSDSNQQQDQENSSPNRVRYTIEVAEENGAYHATEPASNSDIVGRGDTHAEAIANYAGVFMDDGQ
jgi:hypothetical protein